MMEKKQRQFSLLRVLVLLVPLFVLFWWITGGAVPSRGVREKARRVACMTNLKWIEAGKRQWALDHGVTNAGTPIVVTNVAAYFRRTSLPECKGGGVYSIGTLGQEPMCSVHGTMSENFPNHDWNWEIKKMIKAPTTAPTVPSEGAPSNGQ